MQSSTTRRFAPIQATRVLLVAAGLGAGVLALGVTDNLPGQGSDIAQTVQQRSSGAGYPIIKGVRPHGEGEGLIGAQVSSSMSLPTVMGNRSIGQGEDLIGPGSTFDIGRPTIRGIRPAGQGEGLISPGSTFEVARPTIKGTPSIGQGEGLVGPGATLNPAISNGPEQDWADRLPRGEMPTDTIRPMNGFRTSPGIGFNPGDVSVYPAPPSTTGEYTLDPHAAGVTEY